MRNIELLAPARNVEIGIEAIRHGADAIYIGGPSFGARAAAGNSVADIKQLCSYAHIFGAKVYVTLNTILYDDELPEVERVVQQLYDVGVDALITQDLALLSLSLPPIPLHASTQMDNCTPEKAQMLEAAGYSQIVLARELSLAQIKAIHAATSLPIEAFVHGALCVSYSGRCYASEYCFNRSANRGRCAQFCRLAFDLVDAEGKTVVADQHLLSLRDMNRSASLYDMMEAGVSSFKIEGRLKDVSYVKNVTAYYRQAIDAIIQRYPDRYRRSSRGESNVLFRPQLEKSFNRGFTEYFLHGRTAKMWNFITPKSIGERVGRVDHVYRNSFSVEAEVQLNNGDGLVFVNPQGKLCGLRANRVEGRNIYPLKMPAISPGTMIYRNEDRLWETTLEKSTAVRTLPISITLSETSSGYHLSAHHEGLLLAESACDAEVQVAAKPQLDNIIRNLSKLGGTPFSVLAVEVNTHGERFIPASVLSDMRRKLVDSAVEALRERHLAERDKRREACAFVLVEKHVPYSANVSNIPARDYLTAHGAQSVAPAFELRHVLPGDLTLPLLMTCRHCLRYALGQCPKETGRRPSWHEPLSLCLPDGRAFPLRFDCTRCEMQVLMPKQ